MFDRLEVASPQRPWATAAAFVVNSAALTLAILLPMVKPDQLPALNFKTWTVPYSAPRAEVREEARPQPSHTNAMPADTKFRAPGSIPPRIDMSAEDPAQVPSSPYIPGTEGLRSSTTGIPGLPLGATTNPPTIPLVSKPPRPKTIVISHLDEGMLIRRVQPVYPPIARATRAQGTVVLSALINTSGEIEGLEVLSGPALLIESAKSAVKQWKYRPYILNGQPIEVRTQVTVNFTLQ